MVDNQVGGSRVIWHVTMSLDGFIAGPDDEMDWALGIPSAPSAAAAAVVRDAKAVVAGRRWYDAMRTKYGDSGRIYGGAWSGPVFVLTHRAPSDAESAPGVDPGPESNAAVVFLSGDVGLAVAQAKLAGGGNVILFGAQVAAQAIEAGIVDEVVIHLVPVLLGDGVRLFGYPGAPRIPLETISVVESGQIVDLRFRVRDAA